MMDSDQDSNQDAAPSWGSAAAGREAPRVPPEQRRTLEQERAASPSLDGPRRRPSPRYLDANLNEAFPWHEAQDRAAAAAPPRYAAQRRQTDPLNRDQDHQRGLRYRDQQPAGSLRVADREDERGDPRDPAGSPPRAPAQRGGSPQLRARRRLFSCPSGARGPTAGADVRQQLRSVAERDRLKWNFDFESEQPLPGGDFAWEAVPAASVCAFYRPVSLRRAGKRVSDNVAAAASSSSSSSSSSSCPPRVSSSSSASSSSSSSSSSPSSATVSPEPSGPGPGPPSSREASRGGRGGGGGDGGGGGVGDATGSPTGRECSVTCVPRKRSKLSGSRRRANPALCASRTASPAARGSTT